MTVVVATALAAVVSRSGGKPEAASASAVRQVIVPPPATTPPVTEAPAPAPEPTTSSSATTTTAAPPTTTATRPRPVAARQPVPPPIPLTLTAALQQAMGGLSGCLVVEDEDKTVFDHGSGSVFVPASSQKLLVGAAALSRLGADYRFETKVVASGPPQDGTLHDAWLVGGGDPFLATPDYISYLATKRRTAAFPLAASDDPGRRARGHGRAVDPRRPPHRRLPLSPGTVRPHLEAVVCHRGRGRFARGAHRERGVAGWGPQPEGGRRSGDQRRHTPRSGSSPTGGVGSLAGPANGVGRPRPTVS